MWRSSPGGGDSRLCAAVHCAAPHRIYAAHRLPLDRYSPVENLTGKVGGFLGNKKANAEVLLKDVKELLDQRFELKDSVLVDKFIYSRPASEEIIESLASECDFVVTAIAD